jgi:aspartate/methionine/tyrosine aminotransferase
VNPFYANLKVTVFERMSALAREYGAINLGQGFPDGEGPEDIRAKAAEALMAGSNQYPPAPGLPELRQAAAEHYRRLQGLELDWRTEVLVTSGATEALAASILAVITPGDEAVIFEPAYDCYAPQIVRAGGKVRPVRLEPPDWTITREALEAVTTGRTRAVVFCNPQNPATRVYTREEMAVLADWCVRHDLTVISDEVWEHIVFDGRRHVSLMSLPGMGARTIKIGSAGKIFSMTGWKVGLVCAAPPLASAVMKAHQYLTFATAPNLQAAVAYGLGKEDAYFAAMREGFARSRDRLAHGLTAEGFAPLPSEGSYFLNIDLPASGIEMDDETFCARTVIEAGVAAVPLSAFYGEKPVTSVVRLCFAKRDDTLDKAVERLALWRRSH